MNITVIGAGYVGLVSSACFAALGNQVTCIDVNAAKIAQLNQGQVPIYEPGLTAMVTANISAGRLQFLSSLAAQTYVPQIIIIAVGTPSIATAAVDLQYVTAVARDIGRYLTQYCVIVNKSTVPVGMGRQITTLIQEELALRQLNLSFDVVSNPEFLREGAAIDDFMHPDRVIIGCSAPQAQQLMLALYLPLLRTPDKIYFMQIQEAEMTKYVANAMLATRISFMNEIALLCEHLAVDVEQVRRGIAADHRIGKDFLYAGCGYGGSCLPKDVNTLIEMATAQQLTPYLLQAVVRRNKCQKEVLFNKITQVFANLQGRRIAVWGLTFKPDTDDLREATSLVLIEQLLRAGVEVVVYDPIALPAVQQLFAARDWLGYQLHLVADQYTALTAADALVLVTEWQQFLYPDFHKMHQLMRNYYIFDGRNQYDIHEVTAAGFSYYGIGRGNLAPAD